jgi:hypothetical protein
MPLRGLTMIDAEFFETYGPLKEMYVIDDVLFPSLFDCPPITMFCDKCNMERTFNKDYIPSIIDGNVYRIIYKCTACKEFKMLFIIYVNSLNHSIMKIAQWPLWLPKIDADLQKSLGKTLGNYKKGLYCEQEGFGIGAFAYYRRIIEDMIDSLLDDLEDALGKEDKAKYKDDILKAKQERVTEKKIEIVKEMLPSHLRPGGINPLGVIHSILSAGLHGKPEKECLEIAGDIRLSLEYLLNGLINEKWKKKEVFAALGRLDKQRTEAKKRQGR